MNFLFCNGYIDFLKENGIDEVQGYYYSKPLPLDEFERFVVSNMEPVNGCVYREYDSDRIQKFEAHVAACKLYLKILKINLTSDTYNIVFMDQNEKAIGLGFSENISDWLLGFGKTVFLKNKRQYSFELLNCTAFI